MANKRSAFAWVKRVGVWYVRPATKWGLAGRFGLALLVLGALSPSPDRGQVYSPAPVPAPISTPSTMPTPVTPSDEFTQLLMDSTDGIFAIEQIEIIAPTLYEARKQLWRAIDGVTISQQEAIVAEALKQIAYTNNLSWDNDMISKMSTGIVKGLNQWNAKHPEDLR